MAGATVAELEEMAGGGRAGGALVQRQLGDPRVLGGAVADHRDAPDGEVVDHRVVRRAAQGEHHGVEGVARQLRDGAPRVRGWLRDQEHAGRDRVEHLGEAVQDAHGEGIPERVQQPALDDDADDARPALAQGRREGIRPGEAQLAGGFRTRSAVSATRALAAEDQEAVEVDTPAWSATSRRVARA